MKNKAAKWACLIAGLLWMLVGFRDILAPRFFTVRPGVMNKLDIAMEFAAAAVFLVAAASFHWAKPKGEGNEVSTTSR